MKLTKRIPDWHAEVAAELNKDFSEINALEMSARKRRAYLGLKFIWVKETGKADGSIPHGQFMPWLQNNVPQIPIGTVGDYITEGRSLMERMGWQISEIPKFDVPPHKLIESPDAAKTKKDRESQQLLLDLVEGRGKFRPVTEYKQVEEGEDVGERRTKLGRRKGEGGASKEQRLNAQLRDDAERLEALKHWAAKVTAELLENVGVKGVARIDEVGGERELHQLTEAVAYAHGFLQNLKKGRGL